MPTREQIVTFDDADPPPGVSPWVAGARASTEVRVVEADPTWPQRFRALDEMVRGALAPWQVEPVHVGSTAVPGLAAKPIIDISLVLADPDAEDGYVPALTALGFEHRVREPWAGGHRMLRHPGPPLCFLHVYGPDSPEPIRQRLLRDWLHTHPDDVALYAAAKREASQAATAAGEDMMQYNARKQQVVREIYARAFAAAGLLDDGDVEDG